MPSSRNRNNYERIPDETPTPITTTTTSTQADAEAHAQEAGTSMTSLELLRLLGRVSVAIAAVCVLGFWGEHAATKFNRTFEDMGGEEGDWNYDKNTAPSSSSSSSSSFLDGGVSSTMKTSMPTSGEHEPFYRPCQFRQTLAKRPKVLQTSMGDAPSPWAEIPCFVVEHSSPASSSWEMVGSLYRGGAEASESSTKDEEATYWSDGVSYQAPTARIHLGLNSVPESLQNRPPILGFGGAFTEATAVNYNSLSEEGKNAVMELLFGKNGLGYTLGRVHMNSCDFCVASYNFDNVDGDFNLTHFDMNVTHDVQSGMMEMMTKAHTLLQRNWPNDSVNDDGAGLKLMASPWSPPPWMKKPTWSDPKGAKHSMVMTGSAEPTCLREGTGEKSRYAQTWAKYFSKFISAYKNQGVNVWAVTVQNEPEFAAPWEACSYNPIVEGEFLHHHLGPTLRKDHPNVKIFAFDHNKDHAPAWMSTLLNPSNPASMYIDGTAIHWYTGGMDRLLDGGTGAANMHELIDGIKSRGLADDHLVLGSEACHCPYTGYSGGDLRVIWARAERYAHTVLADLAAGSNGWIEWNMLLNATGGPNHLGNQCDGPLLAVPYRATDGGSQSATKPDEPSVGDGRTPAELNAMGNPAQYLELGIVVQPLFSYMGHISRHVRPGSKVASALVDSSSDGRTFRPKGQVTPGGGLNDLARTGIEVTLWPCEGSTRQYWTFNKKGQLEVFGHDWLGYPTTSCVDNATDVDFGGLRLTGCGEDSEAGVFQMSSVDNENGMNIELTNGSGGCLVLKPLKNGGGAYGSRGGAQVALGSCESEEARWFYSEETGEIISIYYASEGGDVCMTTGWPFLQVGAFNTPTNAQHHEKVVVVLNEANQGANYKLVDHGEEDEVILTNSIPAHSIQTVLL